jgi:hypothetical protein
MGKNIQIFIMLLFVIGLNGQTTTWNGTGWSNGKPDAAINAIITANYDESANFSSKTLTVNNGVTFTVKSNYQVIVYDSFVNNGTLIVDSNASFVQRNNTSTYSGSGTAIVKRSANLKRNDYNYWSSPVLNQKLYNFSVGTPTQFFYKYNEPDDKFYSNDINSNSVFEPGIGYAIRGKNSYSTTLATSEVFSFSGIPNNGNYNLILKKSPGIDKGYNLIGNPYPSNLNLSSFAKSLPNRNSMFGKFWFWTNINQVVGQQGSNYAGNNYATYVVDVGGVGPTYISTNIENVEMRPTSTGRVSQGFIIQAKSNNALITFTNSMRATTNSNSIFYNKNNKDEGDEEPEEEVIDRYWLKFINPDNIANNILIAHIADATNDYDGDYDSALFGLGNDAFYSIVGANKLLIQARALPIQDSDIIKLGYKNSKAGNCIIALNDKDGVFKNNSKAIYLKDKLTGTVTNLQNGYYTFTSDVVSTENETRFEILYANDVLAAGGVTKEDLLVYRQNDALIIKNSFSISKAELYDASGRLTTSLSGNNSKEIKISTLGFVKGVYILKITSEKGITTKKVIL